MAKDKFNDKSKDKKVDLTSESKLQLRLIYIFIFAFSFLLYSNTISHGYVLDDDVNTRANKYVQEGLKGIPKIISKSYYHGFNGENEGAYRPVVLVIMAIEKHFWGNDPKVGHLFNLFYYGLACILVFVLMHHLFRNKGHIIPLIISLLFIAHPIHTEVVANIKSRDEILCFLFIILTLIFLVKYNYSKRLPQLILSLLFYFLSLLTKEYGFTLIGVIPVLVYIISNKDIKNTAIATAPYFAVAGVYFLLRSSLLDNIAFQEEMDLINNSLVGATTYSDRLATAVTIMGKYVMLLIYPHPLSFDYSYNQIPIVSWIDIRPIFSLLVYVAMGVITIKALLKKEIVAFGIVFFVFTISIVSNIFVEIGATFAERFLFIPSFGFCIVLVLALKRMLKFNPGANKNKLTFYGIIALLLISYSFKTYDRNKDWKSNLTLFTADVEACPNSARTHYSLASTLNNNSGVESNPKKRARMLQRAVVGFKKSLEIYPEFSSAWYNMGVALYSLGKPEEAKTAYENAIMINPADKQALNNLGVIWFNKKKYYKALEYFLQAVDVNPTFVDSYANIGAVYHNLGDMDNAIAYYNKALELNPNNRSAKENLAKAYRSVGAIEQAN